MHHTFCKFHDLHFSDLKILLQDLCLSLIHSFAAILNNRKNNIFAWLKYFFKIFTTQSFHWWKLICLLNDPLVLLRASPIDIMRIKIKYREKIKEWINKIFLRF